MVRVVHVSDSHLSPGVAAADENWACVVEHVNRSRPDLVVHTGDISADGAERPADLDHARAALDRLEVPWLAVPGNHDLGDPMPAGAGDGGRRARYQAAFGETSWAATVGGWDLVGVDAQLLLSAGEEADAAWDWLESTLQESAHSGRCALFLHRPLRPFTAHEVDSPKRYVTAPGRQRLQRMLDAAAVALVGSGHVHQWRQVLTGGAAHVWAPSTWAVLADTAQPPIGVKVTGVVEHVLDDDGVRSRLVRPDGMRQLTIGVDTPSPDPA